MKQGGFTIIELVISIFILSIAIVGIFNAFSVVTILTSDSMDRLAGTYLVQEGMEIVRNIRDTNWLNMDACAANPSCIAGTYKWIDGLTTIGACSNANTGCEADYTSTSLSGNSGDYLYTNNTNGFYAYNQTNASKAKFKRKIIITYATDADSNPINYIIKVIVQVSWDKKATILNSGISADTCITSNNSNCVITAEETLYDWYNYVNH